ncbi:thioredoxin [Bordetella ansorpii]|uniref:Thioredoxin n=2 Tax=Bordetella ansorpii TaxID=288768 RepID=A0A157QR53_9BORD|nr:thioredoxin [Bordetella ansorpii]
MIRPMNRRLFLHAGAAAAMAAAYAHRVHAAPEPAVSPDAVKALSGMALPDLDGRTHKLSDWRGRPMVVNFWATWCAPCVKEMPELEAMQKSHPKVQFIGIGVDNADNIRKFLAKVPVSYPLVVMGANAIDTLRKLGNPAGGLPFTLVFNADGTVNRKILGQIDAADLAHTVASLAG